MTARIGHLRQLSRICRRFGGKLALISESTYKRLFKDGERDEEDLSDAPFAFRHGIWWSQKIVYAVRDTAEVGTIIHEMGHVFASPHHPHCACSQCHEWSWMGWEIALARQIGAGRTWSQQNENYAVGERGNDTWGNLSPAQRRCITADRLKIAKKLGVVDTEGLPRSIR